jgi:hypothetical protein
LEEVILPSFHLSVKIAKRSQGRSSVAMAAYRAGARLTDERTGRIADYQRRQGIVRAEIIAPEGTSAELLERESLWNIVERSEKRSDAQLAREIELATPKELDDAGRIELVRAFVREQFVALGMIADVAWHRPGKGDDRNHHAHVMLTMRRVGPDGTLDRVKTRAWNSDQMVVAWRQAWANHQNAALERAGVVERVDHRTLEVQRQEAQARGDQVRAIALDRAPEVHMGPEAFRMAERRERKPPSQRQERLTARSRDGAWYSSDKPEKRRRTVDYRLIDRGDRVKANHDRVARNAARLSRRIDRLQVQAARFRERRHRFDQQLAGARLPAKGQGVRLQLTPHRNRRRSLIDALIRDLDRTLARLFGVRSAALLRARILERDRPRGRGRQRHREIGFD